MAYRYAYGKILFIGEYEKKGIPQLVLVEHTLQLLACFDNTVAIIAVYDEDDALGVLKVMPPERPNLVLTTNVPDCELNVLILDCLNVEA